jgi:hypothetical protein
MASTTISDMPHLAACSAVERRKANMQAMKKLTTEQAQLSP